MERIEDLLSFMDSEWKIVFAWRGNDTMGYTDPDTKTIYINMPLMVVGTYIHEYLHARYPGMSEEEVLFEAEYVIDCLSLPDFKVLFKKVYEVAR